MAFIDDLGVEMIFQPTGPSGMGIFGVVEPDHLLREAYHANAPELTDILVGRVRERTPVLTGALQSSISGIAETNVDEDVLFYLFADDAPQLEAWGRVYAMYQEGGTLGLPTYTNPPHMMFARVATDDIDIIQEWADRTAEKFANAWVGGFGSF
jgi:hypothetical protein